MIRRECWNPGKQHFPLTGFDVYKTKWLNHWSTWWRLFDHLWRKWPRVHSKWGKNSTMALLFWNNNAISSPYDWIIDFVIFIYHRLNAFNRGIPVWSCLSVDKIVSGQALAILYVYKSIRTVFSLSVPSSVCLFVCLQTESCPFCTFTILDESISYWYKSSTKDRRCVAF